MFDIDILLADYWEAAYNQGQLRRTNDDRKGSAQRAEGALRSAFETLRRELEETNADCRRENEASMIEIGTLRRELEDMRERYNDAFADCLRLHNEKMDGKWPDSNLVFQGRLKEARALALEEAAETAYRECAQTRHVKLGDIVSAAIRALSEPEGEKR